MPATKSAQPTLAVTESRTFDRPNVPNAAILMSSLRHLGYSNHSAIADVVDNSIDADAQTIAIEVDREQGDFVISVLDDGSGMIDPILDQAMRLGSDTERNIASDLGLYGMGLVTASISIGRRIQVITRAEGHPLLIAVNDLDEVVRRNEFIKYQAEAGPADEQTYEEAFTRNGFAEVPETGTIVTISKSDGMQYSSTGHFVNSLKNHLAQTFRHYISAGKGILVNGEALDAIDPLHLDVEGTRIFSDDVHEFKFKDADGNEVTEKFRLKIALLPDFGEMGNRERKFDLRHQGFYILRNNREIAEAETLGLFTRHSEFNLFRAELSVPATLDDALGVNFTKREVKPGQAFLDKLRQVAQGQLKTIRSQRWKKKAVSDDKQDAHQEAARLITAKQHLLVKPKAEIEKRSPRKTTDTERPEASEDTGRERKNLRRTRLTKDDLRCRFETVSLGEGGQIFEAYQEGRTIIIQWNVDHPFYDVFVNSADGNTGLVTAIDFFVWAWAGAELYVYEDGKNAEVLDKVKSLISMNTRTLLK